MTIKYFYWLGQQQARDDTLWRLALIAIGLVAAWDLLRYVSPAWAARLRPLYLIGGILLFVAGMLIPFISTGGAS